MKGKVTLKGLNSIFCGQTVHVINGRRTYPSVFIKDVNKLQMELSQYTGKAPYPEAINSYVIANVTIGKHDYEIPIMKNGVWLIPMDHNIYKKIKEKAIMEKQVDLFL